MYRVYGALLAVAWAAVLPYQWMMSILKRTQSPLVRERLGALPRSAVPGGIWIHAVSVGEVRLALRLIPGLRRLFPGLPVRLTTGTATGRALGAAAAAGTTPDSIGALPIDLESVMRRCITRLQPRLVLVMETEIWPNLLRVCAARGIPVILVNGRISPRTYPRYRAIRPLMARALAAFRLCLMQTREDADRLVRLGADPGRVRVIGNLKFDLDPSRADPRAVRDRLGVAADTLLFVAGSTAAGEEDEMLVAFARLRRAAPHARCVLAPRHPERFGEAAAAARAAGRVVALWSREPETRAPWDVLVLDRMGILPDVYTAADLVFVGGSLVPRGGQNVLEPAALGKPVVFGPRMDNWRAASEALVAAGAGFVGHDGESIGEHLVRLVEDRALYRVASAMAARVVETNRGALARTLDAIAAEAGVARADGVRARA